MSKQYKTIKNGGLVKVEIDSYQIAIHGTTDIPAASWTKYDSLNQASWASQGLIKLEYKTDKHGKRTVKRLAENAEFYRKQHKAWKATEKAINDSMRKIEKENPTLSKQKMTLVKDADTGEVKRYVKRASYRNSEQPLHMQLKGAEKVKATAAKDAKIQQQSEEIARLKKMVANIPPAKPVQIDPLAAYKAGDPAQQQQVMSALQTLGLVTA